MLLQVLGDGQLALFANKSDVSGFGDFTAKFALIAQSRSLFDSVVGLV
jgi:hypothetical protein